MLGNYRVAWRVVASRIVLSSIELVSYIFMYVRVYRIVDGRIEFLLKGLHLGVKYTCKINFSCAAVNYIPLTSSAI
jgi:hypothetical protein